MEWLSLTARAPRKRVELRYDDGAEITLPDSLVQDYQIPRPSTSATALETGRSAEFLNDSNNNQILGRQLGAQTVVDQKRVDDIDEIIDEVLDRLFKNEAEPSVDEEGFDEPERVVKHSRLDSVVASSSKAIHSAKRKIASRSNQRDRPIKKTMASLSSTSEEDTSVSRIKRFKNRYVATKNDNPLESTGSTPSFRFAKSSSPSSTTPVEPLRFESIEDSLGVDAEPKAKSSSCTSFSTESVATTLASEVDEEEEISLGDASTVLEELEQFVRELRDLRIRRGYTQTHVANLIAAINPNVSQSTVSRFESLSLSFPSIMFLKPFFKIFKDKLEKECRENKPVMDPKKGIWFDSFYGLKIPQARLKRFKRTEISVEMTKTLEKCFIANPTPSAEEIEVMVDYCKLEERVLRVWFANRRRKARVERFSNKNSLG